MTEKDAVTLPDPSPLENTLAAKYVAEWLNAPESWGADHREKARDALACLLSLHRLEAVADGAAERRTPPRIQAENAPRITDGDLPAAGPGESIAAADLEAQQIAHTLEESQVEPAAAPVAPAPVTPAPLETPAVLEAPAALELPPELEPPAPVAPHAFEPAPPGGRRCAVCRQLAGHEAHAG